MRCLYAYQGQHVLAEQRRRTKQVMPGAVALPGGHLERWAQPDEALRRQGNRRETRHHLHESVLQKVVKQAVR